MIRRSASLRLAGLAALLVVAPAAAATAAPPGGPAPAPPVHTPDDDYTDDWTRAEALRIAPDGRTTAPRIPADFPRMTEEVWVWDTWPLTDLDGNVVKYRGWNVIFSLTAPRAIPFPDRHWSARIGVFFSRDGKSWVYGGQLFPQAANPLADREWAGSSILVGDQVHTFYTAAGAIGDGDPQDPLQRLALSTGTIAAGPTGVSFAGFTAHRVIAEADGTWYQTLEQSEGSPIIYAFRDPWVFRDPADGGVYMLFEGNTGGDAESQTCDPEEIGAVPAGHAVPDDARYYTGNIGLARATGPDLAGWTLLPPILAANCTNQQLERPHLVIRNGAYQLFTISHEFTFAPGLRGPDGLYGFVGSALRSDYVPMNASGLVVGNPADAPLQAYSWYVTPTYLAESFIDTVPGASDFGGTLAPTLKLSVRGTETRIVAELEYGVIR